MLMKERRSNNMQSKEDFIEMRVPASAEYVFLIESLMDEVTVYKESGVTISMTKYIKKEQVRNNGERVEIS